MCQGSMIPMVCLENVLVCQFDIEFSAQITRIVFASVYIANVTNLNVLSRFLLAWRRSLYTQCIAFLESTDIDLSPHQDI